MEDPLHPFELHALIPLSLFGLDISLNKAVVMMFVAVALVIGLLVRAGSSRQLVPTRLQSLAEILVEFIRGIIRETMGQEGMRFFPLISSLFLFILFCNLLGLIPGSYTVTSQLVVTGVFAVGVYTLSVVVGFRLHGIRFLSILVPPGTPGWLIPLMIPIELISHLARPLSLSVRLFANMTAGHVILGVLFGLTIAGGLVIGWLPFAFTVALYALELGIAFIQAYIFTILTCVYIGDAIHLH
ncbi:MAG: F0F1 ATP synthase subunit A [Nitrospinae bacterium]|nr:F0F1 ATP synthase subunit A [Nitrospinota bacterium]MCZ6580947.1 F0F1 ATP synthase subunit A [Nitrospirota bacterium]